MFWYLVTNSPTFGEYFYLPSFWDYFLTLELHILWSLIRPVFCGWRSLFSFLSFFSFFSQWHMVWSCLCIANCVAWCYWHRRLLFQEDLYLAATPPSSLECSASRGVAHSEPAQPAGWWRQGQCTALFVQKGMVGGNGLKMKNMGSAAPLSFVDENVLTTSFRFFAKIQVS